MVRDLQQHHVGDLERLPAGAGVGLGPLLGLVGVDAAPEGHRHVVRRRLGERDGRDRVPAAPGRAGRP